VNRHDPANQGETQSLYVRSSTSAIPTGIERAAGVGRDPSRSATTLGTLNGIAEFGFKGGQTGLKKVWLRHDDEIGTGRWLAVTEELANQTLCPVSDDRATKLLGSGDAESANLQIVRQGKEGEIPTVDLAAPVVDVFVVDAPPNAFVSRETR
jgi:hypothetical protein